MESAGLEEYLRIVVDMEKNIFLLEKLVGILQQEIKKLQIPQIFADPSKPIAPEYPVKEQKDAKISARVVLGVILGFAGVWYLAALVSFVLLSVTLVANKLGTAVAVLLLLFLSFVPPIINARRSIRGIQNRRKTFKTMVSKYEKQMQAYQMELQIYQTELKNNETKRQEDVRRRMIKTVLFQNELSQLNDMIASSKKHLQTIYGKNIIFPKYRNLVAVCSLYEYLVAGRCSALEGHEGGYNLYEIEVRMDKIIEKLDVVIVHLNQICSNQHVLHSVIQDVNRQSAQIWDSTRNMAEQLCKQRGEAGNTAEQIANLQRNPALAVYHAERTQKELAWNGKRV